MDISQLILCNLSQNGDSFVKEGPTGCNNTPSYKNKTGMFSNVKDKSDALEAIKLDPAVLEAQVSVHSENKAEDNITDNTNPNIVDEGSKDSETILSSARLFEDIMSEHEAALSSLAPNQLELLMTYADMLRRQRVVTQRYLECAFCKKNGWSASWYTSHVLKDGRGRVQCPVLRRNRCPRCGATGDYAHTIKYCHNSCFSDTRSNCTSNTF